MNYRRRPLINRRYILVLSALMLLVILEVNSQRQQIKKLIHQVDELSVPQEVVIPEVIPEPEPEVLEENNMGITSPQQLMDLAVEAATLTPIGGLFQATAYCSCTKCCGPNAKGITASGTKVKAGRTIAVDPKVIPLGTTVYVEGYGTYIAEDTGSAIKGNIIDIYFDSHSEALEFGRKQNLRVSWGD